MDGRQPNGFRGVVSVLGRPFRRKQGAASPSPTATVVPRARPDAFEIPFVEPVSYEPFRDYRPGRAGDPSRAW